jgi:hypothetical protein
MFNQQWIVQVIRVLVLLIVKISYQYHGNQKKKTKIYHVMKQENRIVHTTRFNVSC